MKKRKFHGSNFIANIHDLVQLYPKDVESLASTINSELSKRQNDAKLDLDFCGNGAVLKDGKYYYLERFPKATLLSTLYENPGFYLIHGPRGSGKSTLLLQMMKDLDDSCYVFGKVEFLENIPVSDMWTTMAKSLGEEDSNASKEVREAAKKYLESPTRAASNLVEFLFRQDYDGKKLVLFFDEFDRAYDMKYRKEVALTFREMSNAVINSRGSFSTFGGVVSLGAFNATLVNVPGVSVFAPKRYTHETLDFSLNETEEQFWMYEEKTKAKVAGRWSRASTSKLEATRVSSMSAAASSNTNLEGVATWRSGTFPLSS